MNLDIIAIEGHHLNHSSELFSLLGYSELGREYSFNHADDCYDFLDNNLMTYAEQGIALRAIWLSAGWTLVSDPEGIDSWEETALEALSKLFNAEVLNFSIHTTSNIFGFSSYHSSLQRKLWVIDGAIQENIGVALAQERNVIMNEKVFVDDILKLASNFGIDLHGEADSSFIVKQLAYEETAEPIIHSPLESLQNESFSIQSKPWWKFW